MYLENAKKLEMYGLHLQDAKVFMRSFLVQLNIVICENMF